MSRHLLIALLFSFAGNALAETIVLRADRLVDVRDGDYVKPAVIVIDGDRITGINPPTVPAGARVIELPGHTLLPGPIDLHSHLTNTLEGDWKHQEAVENPADWALLGARNARVTLQAGFTTTRDIGNNGGVSCGSGMNLFGRVGNRPLPEWAAEFDARTWAHFFLKYVISHPAITVARVGTTKPHHMLDNMGGGIGRLPDEATRKRMAKFIDALPPVTIAAPSPQSAHGPAGSLVLPAALLDRYVGEYRTTSGQSLTFRRYGTMLVAKAGPDPDRVIYGQSETRFRLGTAFIEFQLDSTGKATGLIHEQGSQKVPATRVR